MAFLGLFLFVPLAAVFAEALKKGWSAYLASIAEPDALAAISPDSDRRRHKPCRSIRCSGSPAAWAIAKFDFPRQEPAHHADRPAVFSLAGHRRADLRAAVRPAGWLGPWLREHDLKIIFALPAIVLATLFVTVPFVARELIPLIAGAGARGGRGGGGARRERAGRGKPPLFFFWGGPGPGFPTPGPTSKWGL